MVLATLVKSGIPESEILYRRPQSCIIPTLPVVPDSVSIPMIGPGDSGSPVRDEGRHAPRIRRTQLVYFKARKHHLQNISAKSFSL